MVWDPTRITPKPWAGMLEFYRHIEERNDDFRPLGRLALHIASQAYAASIAGATSGTALLVARSADADWVHEAMRIDVSLAGSIRFTLPGTRLARPMAVECEGDKIVGVFESLLRKAKWLGP
jgi:hypothetical protein